MFVLHILVIWKYYLCYDQTLWGCFIDVVALNMVGHCVLILVLDIFPVDNTKVMLGTFGPQSEPYTYVMEEEITPSGILARGSYSSRTKVRKHNNLNIFSS